MEVESRGERREEREWCRRVLDKEEAKKQIVFAAPMVLTNLFYFLTQQVSLMYAGHLGQLALAGSTLANAWANVSGLALLVGLSGSLETLCGQAFGAQEYRKLGIYLQASTIISFISSVILAIIWWYTELILVLLHQKREIAEETALYIRYLIPGIFAYGGIQNILRFLQTQYVIWPLVLCSFIPLASHIGLAYLLIHHTPLAFRGAPLAVSISVWFSLILLVLYVAFSKKLWRTWGGLSTECFHYVWPNLKLALPSAAMIRLEYWVFEIMVILAGLMPNSEVTTSVIAMCVNTGGIAFMIFYGLSAAASTRVSNELGAGRPDRAKTAMGVTLRLAVVLASILLVAFGVGHNAWASLFSNSKAVIKNFAALTPFICMSVFLDGIQSMLSGVCRGGGWQNLAMFINLGAFYVVGLPIACVLAFKVELYVKGLWMGLICGLVIQLVALLLLTRFQNWSKVTLLTYKSDEQEHVEGRNLEGQNGVL